MTQFAVSDVIRPVDAFVTLDLNLGYRLNEALRWELGGRNLLDSGLEQTAGPLLERQVYTALNYRF